MKWQNLFTNLLTTVGLMGLGMGLPVLAQTTNPAAPLNTELNQAVCQQDWTRAIRVIDRMRPQTPADRRGELTVYRSRLQALLNSGTPIPNWQCGAGGASLSTAPTGTTTPANPAPATNNSATTSPATNPANGADPAIRGVRRSTSDSRSPSNANPSNANPSNANPSNANPSNANPSNANPSNANPSNGDTPPTGANNIIDRARNLNSTIDNP